MSEATAMLQSGLGYGYRRFNDTPPYAARVDNRVDSRKFIKSRVTDFYQAEREQ